MSKTYSMRFGSGDPRTYAGLAPTFLSFINLTNGATLTPPSITSSQTGSGFYQFSYGTTQPIAFLADAATTSPGSAGRYVTGQIDPNDRSDEYAATMIAIGTTLIGYGFSAFAQGATLFGIGTSNIALGMSNIALGTSNFAFGTSNFALGTTSVAFVTTINTNLTSQGLTLVAMGVSLTNIGLMIGTTASSFGSTSIDPVDLYGFLKRAQEMAEGNQTYTKGTTLLDFFNRGSSTLLREKTITDSTATTTKT